MVSYFLFSFLLLIAMQFERFRGALTILIDILNSNIKLNESTASLFARMHLFKVSINMINENWLLGIGSEDGIFSNTTMIIKISGHCWLTL